MRESGRTDELRPRTWLYSVRGWLFVTAVLVGITTLVWTFGGNSLIQVATMFLLYVGIATGVQTFMGFSGIASFGHLAFAAIGAYTAAIVATPPALKESMLRSAPDWLIQIDGGFVPAVLAGMLVAGIAAAVFGLALTRLSRDTLPLATLGLLVVASIVAMNWKPITNGHSTFYGLPLHTTLWTALGFAAVVVLLARLFRDSRVGMALRATRDDELASSASGVAIVRVRYIAWVLSAILVGAGGAMYSFSVGIVSPSLFYFDLTFLILTVMVIGGSSVSGVVAGAFVVISVNEVLRRLINEFGQGHDSLFSLIPIGPALIVLLILILRPDGLFSRWEIDELIDRARRTKRLALRAAKSDGPPEEPVHQVHR